MSCGTKRNCNGISEARILSLLRSAYSQNYAYLIKKPNNQYQVIVEVQDNDARIRKT